MLDVSALIGKVAVLSQRSVKTCAFAHRDRDVFVSSERWESKYEGDGDKKDEEEDEEEGTSMQAQMSQDY